MIYQRIKKLSLKKILIDAKDAVLSPQKYYSLMGKEGDCVETLFRTLLYGILIIILSFPKLLYISNSSFISLFVKKGILVYISIVSTLFTNFMFLFIGGLIIVFISALCKGTTNFNLILRISSTILILLPLNTLCGYSEFIHSYISIFLTHLIQFYGIWMLYNSIIMTLEAGGKRVKTIAIIISVFVIFFTIFDYYMAYNSPSKSIKQRYEQSPINQLLKNLKTQEIK